MESPPLYPGTFTLTGVILTPQKTVAGVKMLPCFIYHLFLAASGPHQAPAALASEGWAVCLLRAETTAQ